MFAKFDAEQVWGRIAAGQLTLFMAVPTIYGRLITAWDGAAPERRRQWSAGCAPPRMRLMVSGSAALPVQRLERWREDQRPRPARALRHDRDRHGIGNPLHGERRPGFVGTPLPGVEVRLVDDAGRAVPAGTPGEIEVRAQRCFFEYWRRPDATAEAFRDGWFRTGDVALLENGSYRILGRSSVDIIKDRRLQSVGARGRGGVADAPGDRGSAPWWAWRIRVGRAHLRRSRAARCSGIDARRPAGVGQRSSRTLQDSARAPLGTSACRATPWVRSRRARWRSSSPLECQGAVKVRPILL